MKTNIRTRTDLLNFPVKRYRYKAYLEIGIGRGANFRLSGRLLHHGAIMRRHIELLAARILSLRGDCASARSDVEEVIAIVADDCGYMGSHWEDDRLHRCLLALKTSLAELKAVSPQQFENTVAELRAYLGE